MTDSRFLLVSNPACVALADVPELSSSEWRDAIVTSSGRLAALFHEPQADAARLYAVVAFRATGRLGVITTVVDGSYPALTPDLPQAHLFEREIFEASGVIPTGHPGLKPVRYPHTTEPGVTDYFAVEGEEIHEVAVGPVHAGVIEPGHFRFQCHGENVLHLEISLGYQHRGVEKALIGGPNSRTIHYMETLAGDTSIGHATAYCQAHEALSAVAAPARAQAIRAVALELERMANHTGDLGALAGDVAYLPTASFCGRLRGDILNMTALICGSRFGRGLIRPGGVSFDIDADMARALLERLALTTKDLRGAVSLLWDAPSVLARFEDTGIVSKDLCETLGLVGPAARACGVPLDTRSDFPSGMYRFRQLAVATWPGGDVFARAFVRWMEIQESARFVEEQIQNLPSGPVAAAPAQLAPRSCAVSLVEGWRGEICHVAITGDDSRLKAYKVVDPSFHNWTGLAMALRAQQISDFPLINKSFNLSYCGHDL